tara:strand:- start:49 stop:177 length:129 start_codon:yes stop_codon:yes gene_type:complete
MNMTTGELMMVIMGILLVSTLVSVGLIIGTEIVLRSINGDLD